MDETIKEWLRIADTYPVDHREYREILRQIETYKKKRGAGNGREA